MKFLRWLISLFSRKHRHNFQFSHGCGNWDIVYVCECGAKQVVDGMDGIAREVEV